MKRKPYVTTGALFMGLIVLLGVMGVVSGLWSKNLVINGQVTTGDLNADWDCGYTNDDGLTALVIVEGGGCADARRRADDRATPAKTHTGASTSRTRIRSSLRTSPSAG